MQELLSIQDINNMLKNIPGVEKLDDKKFIRVHVEGNASESGHIVVSTYEGTTCVVAFCPHHNISILDTNIKAFEYVKLVGHKHARSRKSRSVKASRFAIV